MGKGDCYYLGGVLEQLQTKRIHLIHTVTPTQTLTLTLTLIKVVQDFLPVLDNLDRARTSIQPEGDDAVSLDPNPKPKPDPNPNPNSNPNPNPNPNPLALTLTTRKVVQDFLPVLDNLDRARTSIQPEGDDAVSSNPNPNQL